MASSGSPMLSPQLRGKKGKGEDLQTLQVKPQAKISYRKKFPFQLVASGTAGVDELAEHLAIDKVFFGMLQMEIGSGTFARTKNIFITWCPDDHPKPLSRAKAMKSLKKAQECVGQCHSELTLSELSQCSIEYIFNYLEQKRVFNADNIEGDGDIREEYNRKMAAARDMAQENELRITQLQAQARQRIERRRRRSIGSEADSVMTDFSDWTDMTEDPLSLDDGLSSLDMLPLGQGTPRELSPREILDEEPQPEPEATEEKKEVVEEEKKEPEVPKKKKKKGKRKRKKDDWSDDRPWTGERILKCIQADSSPINWALFGASDSEIIPLVWGHGDLNQFREAMPPDRVAYGLYRIAFGSGRWRRTHRIFVLWTPDSMTKDLPQKKRTKKQTERMMDVAKQEDMKRLLSLHGGIAITAEDHDKVTIEEFILRVRATLAVDGDDEFLSEEAFLAALAEEERFFAEKKRLQEEERQAKELLENPKKKKKRKKRDPNDPSEGEDGDNEDIDGQDAAHEVTFENTDEEVTPQPPEAPKEAATESKEQQPRTLTVAVGQGDEEDAEVQEAEESPRTVERKRKKKEAAKKRRENEIQAQVVVETVRLVHNKSEPLVWVLFVPFDKKK